MKPSFITFCLSFQILLLIFANQVSFSQTPVFDSTIIINQSFTTHAEIYPFNGTQMYGTGIGGTVTFYSDTSIVKIILRDSLSTDYLIYETNTYLNEGTSFSFSEECEETCFLNGFTPTSIELQIVGSSLFINNFKYCSTNIVDATTLQNQAREAKIDDKIDRINDFIVNEGLIWVAGETSFLNMFYNEKKDLYKSSIWNPAIEYYVSGFFGLKSPANGANITVNYDYVDNFEWRNRHGANDPSSFYFDGSDDGSGWITKAACQSGCWTNNILDCSLHEWQCSGANSEWRSVGTCWAFGPTSHIEALVNLYLNQHLDVDLAEQEIVSCSYSSPHPSPGSSNNAFNYFRTTGVVNEECFLYTAQATPCEDVCEFPIERIKISSHNILNPTQQQLREAVMQNGPVCAAWMNCMWGTWSHSMQLVGWDVIEWGDEDILGVPPDPITFADYIGCTYWIYKQNYGDRDDMHGFVYMIHENDDTPTIYIVPTNTTNFVSSVVNTFDETDIACLDNDEDGYYNWGIGPKPPQCPPCPSEPDGDDNNSGIGPLDENGFCTIIDTYNSSFEKTMNYWKQSDNDDCDWIKYHDATASYPISGPNGTPDDSDFYIYMNASKCYLNAGAYIESPPISLSDECAIEMTFAYHKNTNTWGNDETDDSKLSLDISYDGGQTWDEDYWYVMRDQGNEWHYVTIDLPSEVNKVRFYAYVGWVNFYNDIAIDDITIGPASTNDLIITGNETWAYPNYQICQNMIIEPNATLTLENSVNVFMNESAKIIVKPGGQLIVDGATITSTSDQLWQGIEVWGNPSLSQIPANQGWLVITNGGTIENAEVAVRAGSADYTGKGGGIVSAENAVFLNNTVSAMFDPYTAYTNTSAFGSCTFNYTKTITSGFKFYFARLDNVISVQFNNCTFTNNSDQDYVGAGIKSINSIFIVEGQCTEYSGTECIEWDNGLFENLEYGVYATASTTTRFADIRHTDFTDNFHGIYLGGMTLPRVTSNEFHLDRTAAQGGYGLYLDGSTQYWVEDNSFNGNNSDLPTGIGIYVNASGSLANEIYLNSFDYIEYAVTVLGYNRNSRTTTTGLQIRCNYYDNTLYDETIVHEGPFLPGSDGIASIQGNNSLIPVPTDMAGNLFYYNTTVSGDFDDLNNQSNHFYYYYSNNAGSYHVEPLDYTTGTVTKQPKTTTSWTYENGCPSNLTPGGGGGTEESRAAMNEALSDIESTETVLLALVDGGDTESLKTEVETSTPPETAEIYNELMTGSPYLSETVVGTAIDKEEVLPNSMVRDVMVANPHTSTSLQLLDKLDDRTNPMPAWMKAQILAGRSIQSLKTELEGQLAGYQMAKCRAMNSLARHFGQQPENPAITDSLIALYQSDNTISSRYMQAWLYLNSGQYQQGQNVMASIPANFTLAEDELAEYQNIQWLYVMLKGLLESGNGLDDLSEAQIAQLHAIVADETDFASVYARNMLLAIDELEYQEPIILPNSMKSAEVEEAYHEVLNSQAPTFLEVYPNPSKDFIILGYQFDKETKGMIEIRDISGKPVQSIPFNGIQDQVTVTTRGWIAGVYVISLVVNDKVIETVKFTLLK